MEMAVDVAREAVDGWIDGWIVVGKNGSLSVLPGKLSTSVTKLLEEIN